MTLAVGTLNGDAIGNETVPESRSAIKDPVLRD